MKNDIKVEIVYFSATHCGPCKVVGPTIQTFSDDRGLPLKKIFADETPEEAKAYNVKCVPTVIFMVDGKEECRMSGNMITRDKLDDMIRKFTTA